MKRFIQARPTPAMAVAFTALLLALGGTAVALPGKNTVDSGDIKNNSIRAADLRSRSLDGTDIKINRVGGNAIKEEGLELEKIGKVPLAELADRATAADTATTATTAETANTANTATTATTAATANAVAPNGVNSAAIQDDAVTAAKIGANEVRASELTGTTVRSTSDVVAPADSGIVSLGCNAGEQMLSGGGFFNLFLQANKGIQASFPLGNGWAVIGRNNTGVDQTLNVNVVCLAG